MSPSEGKKGGEDGQRGEKREKKKRTKGGKQERKRGKERRKGWAEKVEECRYVEGRKTLWLRLVGTQEDRKRQGTF